MKQLLQSPKTGEVWVEDIPAPGLQPGTVQVRNRFSVVSAGTERATVEFGRQGMVGKARARPDLVREVVTKAKRDGLLSTIASVRNRLDESQSLGYSCAGTVLAVGEGVMQFKPGDRVACAGAGYAAHAEVVSVPKNLVVAVADQVELESAAFTTIGAIALQSIRLADTKIGEVVAVLGLGLVGQIAVRLLKAAGCTVVAMDPIADRCNLAEKGGCDTAVVDDAAIRSAVAAKSSAAGADAVIIAAATSGDGPIELAGELARDRGVVVAVGAVGMNVPRRAYYEKELNLRVSRSYGPGRYDPKYEEKGQDYPIGHVRWTENRNMRAFVQQLAEGRIDLGPLVSHRFPIDEAAQAYDLVTRDDAESNMGIVITYDEGPDTSRRLTLRPRVETRGAPASSAKIGLLGAGAFAASTLLPAMKKARGVEFVTVCSAGGRSARHLGDRFGFVNATTDEADVLEDSAINTVVIATRHHLHARQAVSALVAGKHVFCEKPLALNEEELGSVVAEAAARPSALLAVGYNRRFSPMTEQLMTFLEGVSEPLVIQCRINAGYLSSDHWIQDPEQGGGRIVGEVCHFVDLMTLIAGGLPVRVAAHAVRDGGRYRGDNVVATIEFSSGAIATITYVANGDASVAKERIEVFGGGRVAVLDDFRRLQLTANGKTKARSSRLGQNKGHRAQWETFVKALGEGEPWPVALEDLVSTSLATFAIEKSVATGQAIEVDAAGFITSAGSGGESAGSGAIEAAPGIAQSVTGSNR